MERYFSKAVDFLKGIKEKDEVIIIFHNDGDGISSAAVMNRLVKSITGYSALLISQPMPINSNITEKIKTTIPTKIIFIDLAVDQNPEIVKKVAGYAPTLVIDHHIIANNMNSKRIVHYNPRFTKADIFQSASYLAHKLCSEVAELDALWISMVGIVADYNLADSKDIVSKARKKYSVKNPKSSIFSEIGNMIFSSKTTKRLTPEQMCSVLTEAKGPEFIGSLPDGEAMMESNFIIQKEIDSAVRSAASTMKKQGNLVIFEILSSYNIRSPVTTIVSEKHEDKLVIGYVKEKGKVKFSARNQKKNINAGKILESAIRGFRGSAGGHEAAAAGIIPEKDWEQFLQKLAVEINS